MKSDELPSEQKRPCALAASRASLVDEVVEKLRQLIESIRLSSGARLPSEAELTSQLQMSRTVLREAVKQLGAVGMIRVRHDDDRSWGSMTLMNRTTRPEQMLRAVVFLASDDSSYMTG